MSRIMYDSVTSRDIPRGAVMVAGYVDGLYAWSAADWALHAGARQVRITVTGGTLDAQVADVENGDLTPAQGAAWLARKKHAGQLGSLYFSRSRYGEVAAAVHAAGLGPSDWTVWVADWTYAAHGVAGAYATQYADPPRSGGHYDLSLVADHWPGIDPGPAPAPAPAPSPTPTPTPPPPAPAGPPVNEARAAFASLASALTTGLQGLLAEIDQAAQKLKDS